MEDFYYTLEKNAEGVFRDRNSRFLAFGYPVETVDQANETLGILRKKYHDARHHCYAWRIGPEKEVIRMNDDGEPSGTAGKPIFNQIAAHDVKNILVVVVRYFGGTLLGTGGLINAYRSATLDMFNHASVVKKYVEDRFNIWFAYEKMNAVMTILKDENLQAKPVFKEQCMVSLSVRKSLAESIRMKFSALGEITLESL